MKVRIGTVVVEFLCDREEIRDHISHLLRYHKARRRSRGLHRAVSAGRNPGAESIRAGRAGRVLVPLRPQFPGKCDAAVLLSRAVPGFAAGVLRPRADDGPRLPAGAGGWEQHPADGAERRGKSTCAAAWLNGGMPLMGDDTLCIAGGRCYPLKRELHIGEDSLAKFPRLKGTRHLEPYMPGYRKLGYDWIALYPELVLEAAPLPQVHRGHGRAPGFADERPRADGPGAKAGGLPGERVGLHPRPALRAPGRRSAGFPLSKLPGGATSGSIPGCTSDT